MESSMRWGGKGAKGVYLPLLCFTGEFSRFLCVRVHTKQFALGLH